jgi:hypothetical protein
MVLLAAVIVGVLAWDNWQTDREEERKVDQYTCILQGGEDCDE